MPNRATAKPSARWTTAMIPDQTGRVALVTGANSGLGFAIAEALAVAGATVFLACRNADKAEEARRQIQPLLTTGSVQVLQLDLASLDSVSAAVGAFHHQHQQLDLLINNAGLMAVDRSTTADGFEMQFGVNHLGHFALTLDLLPTLMATPHSRVVSMASMGHRMGSMNFDDIMFAKKYDRWRPYFQSKLANILFTLECDRRLRAQGSKVAALVAHPGGSRTDLGSEGRGLTNKLLGSLVPLVTQSAARGAEPALRAATDPTATGGQYYGPHRMTMGHAVLETPSKAARNEADALRLWELSERLTGRRFPA
jgi:protochlorophyllide reductase